MSKLENGFTAKPRKTTIDAYCKALKITDAELQTLREQLKTTNTPAANELLSQNADLVQQLDQREILVRALALEYAPDAAADFKGAVAGLRKALEAARDMSPEALPSNLGEAVDAVLREAAKLREEGQVEDALATIMEGITDSDARAAEEAAAKARMLEEGLRYARMANDPESFATLALQKAHQDMPADIPRAAILPGMQELLFEQGKSAIDPFDLRIAIALARKWIEDAPDPETRAAGQNNLGNALRNLGLREEGIARLEEAVVAYRAALEVYNREVLPEDWAMTQNNLGNALGDLGSREEGTARLEEAVTAYRAALEVYNREVLPEDWATVQNNLGAALYDIGRREEGTARLEEAVAAYRAALEVYTREAFPVDWAMTQNNLGATLRDLGVREEGTARLEEAVVAYRAALEVHTREALPVEWAMTQNNLGNALGDLGLREKGTARLEEAVAAYRAALEVRTREATPFQWAQTQENLAITLHDLWARTEDRSQLETAQEAVRGALDVYEAGGAAYDIGTAIRLRDKIEAALTKSAE